MDKTLEPPSLDPSAQALFLDYDGTLVEIAPTPEEARADRELLELLGRLQERLDGALAIVTGRPVGDIDSLLHPLQLTVAALHGLAVRRGDGSAMAAPVAPSLLDPAREAFSAFAAEHSGTRVEDKGLSVALHFRGAPSAGRAADELASMLAGAGEGALRLQRGKMVVELLPAGADKGKAIAALMVEPPFQSRRPVFVGDDVTDEAGFATVNLQGGLSLRVGDGAGAADFLLRDVSAVRGWLRRGLSA
jgi:trehalose 6-phosphate phosphatase